MANVFHFRGSRYGHTRTVAQFLGLFVLGAFIAFAAAQYERLAHFPALANAPFTVVDGDTVRTDGQTYRLIGIDTPETGANARYANEDATGREATERLRQLVTTGNIELLEVRCACGPGTEGTENCNFGRVCGLLYAYGRDVGSILISEGLARPYHCSATGCPRRQNWCG